MNYDALAAIQAAQPPPPYHIAILLPGKLLREFYALYFMNYVHHNFPSVTENSKEMIDESPPPAYDKIVI